MPKTAQKRKRKKQAGSVKMIRVWVPADLPGLKVYEVRALGSDGKVYILQVI